MSTATKSRPILFSGPMVRAILAGRKTQTRRVVKFPAWMQDADGGQSPEIPQQFDGYQDMVPITAGHVESYCHCPYGQPGDELWVRETWVECLHTSPGTDQPHVCDGDKLIEHATQYEGSDGKKHWRYDGRVICYRATSDVEFCDGDGFTGDMANRDDMPRWRPSIHMPRWASRITLAVTDVRVERLQDISEADAIAEGVELTQQSQGLYYKHPSDQRMTAVASLAFQWLWESINGPDSWDANPWVWVVEFERKQ